MISGRKYGNDDAYRYGFQGQEKDDEIKGGGNSINFKFRMYDPRLGRFFAVDQLTREYPHFSPYSFSGNRVIDSYELDGLEPLKDPDGKISGEFKAKFKVNLPDGGSVTIYGKVHGTGFAITPEDRNRINNLNSSDIYATPRNIFDASFVTNEGGEAKIQAGVGGVSVSQGLDNLFRSTLIIASSTITQTINTPRSTNNTTDNTSGLGVNFTRGGVPTPPANVSEAGANRGTNRLVSLVETRANDLLGNSPVGTNRTLTSINVNVQKGLSAASTEAIVNQINALATKLGITANITEVEGTSLVNATINFNDQTQVTVPTVVKIK